MTNFIGPLLSAAYIREGQTPLNRTQPAPPFVVVIFCMKTNDVPLQLELMEDRIAPGIDAKLHRCGW